MDIQQVRAIFADRWEAGTAVFRVTLEGRPVEIAIAEPLRMYLRQLGWTFESKAEEQQA